MEEGGVNINCNSRPSTTSLSLFFFSISTVLQSAESSKLKHPILLLHTHTHTSIYTHSNRKGWERDNRETTAVSYRKCITAQQSGGEEVVGLRRAWTWRARGRFLPLSVVNCPDLQGLQGHGYPILVPSNLDSS